MSGKFIVFEGIDGAGTTTQRNRLVRWVEQRGKRAHSTAEPSSLQVGQLIRKLLSASSQPFDKEAMALLFAADRRDHLASEVVPQVSSGAIVVCDRYFLSSMAYQVPAGVPSSLVFDANMGGSGLLVPDLLIFVRVRPDVAAGRRASRGGAAEIYDDADMQACVAAAYENAVEEMEQAGWPCHVVDGGADPDSVEREIRKLVEPLISG